MAEWQGHEDSYPLLLEYVFRLLHFEPHYAYGAAGQQLGKMHAMVNFENLPGVYQDSAYNAWTKKQLHPQWQCAGTQTPSDADALDDLVSALETLNTLKEQHSNKDGQLTER